MFRTPLSQVLQAVPFPVPTGAPRLVLEEAAGSMESGQAADLAIFVCCCALLLGYNIFYFSVASFTFFKRRYIILYAVNRQSRASWVQHLSKGGAGWGLKCRARATWG